MTITDRAEKRGPMPTIDLEHMNIAECALLMNSYGVIDAKKLLRIDELEASGDPDAIRTWRFTLGAFATRELSRRSRPKIRELHAPIQEDEIVGTEFVEKARTRLQVGWDILSEEIAGIDKAENTGDEFYQRYQEFKRLHGGDGKRALWVGVDTLRLTLEGTLIHIFKHVDASGISKGQLQDMLRKAYGSFTNPQARMHKEDFNALLEEATYHDGASPLGYHDWAIVSDNGRQIIHPEITDAIKEHRVKHPLPTQTHGCVAHVLGSTMDKGAQDVQKVDLPETHAIWDLYFDLANVALAA